MANVLHAFQPLTIIISMRNNHGKKMKSHLLRIILICTAFISCNAFADNTPTTSSTQPTGIQAICPAPDTLTKDSKTMLWSAPGGWKSYQTSFAMKIRSFLGAQWDGVAVGQVVCLYQPSDQFAFAIQLFYDKIVFEPKNKPWSNNLKGYRNCTSHHLKDCSFVIRVKPKEDADIYQSLQNYKKDPSTQNQQQGF